MAIIIPIGIDTSGLTRGLSQGTSGLRKFGKMAALVGGAAAFGGLVAVLKVGVDEFMQAQKVMAQTNAVLKSTGGVAKVSSGHITSMSTSLMKLSGIDDEAIQSGQNLLLTFTKIRNEAGAGNKIFDQATLAMTNLSVAMGKDLNSSALLVGKALNDPVKGVGALSRAGVQFTASQKDTIKALVESGDTMGAQKIILKELETQFGGSAKAAGQTLPGQLNILKETFRNVSADLVTIFIPYLSRAAASLLGFVREFAARPTFVGRVQFVVGKLTDAVGAQFNNLYDWWTKSKSSVNTTGTITFSFSGKEQFDRFFSSLEQRARQAGRNLVTGLLAGIRSEANQSAGSTFRDIFSNVFEVLQFTFRISGTTLAMSLIDGIVEELANLPSKLNAFLSQSFLDGLRVDLRPQVSGKSLEIVKGKITKAVREAVASARDALAGMGSSIGSMLAQITGASSPAAIAAANIRKQQAIEKAAREKKALLDAVAGATTDEERAQATQDLNDFLVDQEAMRLEQSVADQQSANQTAIDNLIEQFNTGAISAQNFSDQLNGIIGADRGAALGSAFAGAFGREIAGIIASARDIQSVVGQGVPITAGGSTTASDAARQAHADYVRRRRERRALAVKNKRTPEEIRAIMEEWDRANPEPVRMALGGILKKQVFTAGESGAEAVIPLGSSQAMSMLRDAIGGGSGGTTYNLVVNAGLGTNPDELGRVIVESIKKYERRNGQVFMGPSIQATSAGVSTSGGVQTRARSIR